MFDMRCHTFAVVDPETGSHVEYEGPFTMYRGSGHFEITAPIHPHRGGETAIPMNAVEHLQTRTGDLCVATGVGELEAIGVIETMDVLEGALTVRVDDGAFVDPDDVMAEDLVEEVH